MKQFQPGAAGAGSGSIRVADVVNFLQRLAPLSLAESWDNVGLLWGDDTCQVERVLTCLTLTSDVAREAVERGAGLIISHHPILFQPVQQITTATIQGRLLLELARRSVAVYSAHTAYDNTTEGINDQLAVRLELRSVGVIRPTARDLASGDSDVEAGAGRFGDLDSLILLGEFIDDVKERLRLTRVDSVGPLAATIARVAIACGSGGDFISDAAALGCQVLVTGEARFHDCLAAREQGLALVLLGHYSSERPAMRQLAEQIASCFPSLTVWASDVETDPIERH